MLFRFRTAAPLLGCSRCELFPSSFPLWKRPQRNTWKPWVAHLWVLLITFISKGCIQVIPVVLIATCDTSVSVSNQADAVLSENFPGEKSTQATLIFAPDTMKLAVDIIAGRHALVQPQKWVHFRFPGVKETLHVVQIWLRGLSGAKISSVDHAVSPCCRSASSVCLRQPSIQRGTGGVL